jgi:hypothetical protein
MPAKVLARLVGPPTSPRFDAFATVPYAPKKIRATPRQVVVTTTRRGTTA